MSEADQAQELEAKRWEMLNSSRPPLPVFEPGQPGYGPEECYECGDEMHSLRREMGFRLCTECTKLNERLTKNRA